MKMILGYRSLDTSKLVYLGDMNANARCTSRDKYYSKPEDLEQAQIEFNKRSLVMRRQADKYYSQGWV